MKKLFRKATAILANTALIGATVGMAAAASYPEPFESNTAIVVGANAAPSDNIAAASIASNLDASAATGAVTYSGTGDTYKFEKISTKFHIGDNITEVVSSSLDDDHLPELLAEGTFTDDDNDDFDFTQKIAIDAGLQLVMFDDNDYSRNDPTLGFRLTSNKAVLNYTLEMTTEPIISDMPTADLIIMDRQYYVLAATDTRFTLLDSAVDTIITEGESTTINAAGKSYTVDIEFINTDSVKLNVNGEITRSVQAQQTYKLSDGSYLGIREILYNAKDSGISKVEFSIGRGKLILDNSKDVELNEKSVDGLTSTITNGTDSTEGATFTDLNIQWKTDDRVFITEDMVAIMPGFDIVSLAYTGVDYTAEEEIQVSYDGDDAATLKNFPLKDTTEDIYLLYSDNNANFTGIGRDADELVATADRSIVFDRDIHSYFIASWSDSRDAESYMMRASSFTVDGIVNKTTIQRKKDGVWVDAKAARKPADSFSVGNVELLIGAINRLDKTVNITANTANTNFNTLYSKEGMKILLPYEGADASPAINLTDGNKSSAYLLQMIEEDKNGDTGAGSTINVTIGFNTQATPETTITLVAGGGATSREIGDTDVFRNFVYSALATEILFDKSGDQNLVNLMYHGEEVEAKVFIAAADAVSYETEAGVMTVTDNAVSSVAGKNLIVVGGSAINSVAAELLGGSYREAAFTSSTGVAAGEFLIESFNRAGTTALLVAGYNAADTEKAVTYLLNNDVDTTVAMKMKGTSATEATIVTA